MTKLHRVLAAVDFSAPGRAAFDHALALSRLHAAELTVVNAIPTDRPFSWDARERVRLMGSLSDAARASLDANAAWLRRWPSTKVTIEGHADSRGTNEYNLALGDRRAAAARDYLVSLGISADRLAAISKGEEQPFCGEETEACWAQNRRGYFVITAK